MTEDNKKKILIAHGWGHSAGRYERLKEDLEKTGKYEVTLYEFPGFGNTPAKHLVHVVENYAKDMLDYLSNHSFDFAIGHSMGGNILLRVYAEKSCETELILLSPVYCGVEKAKVPAVLAPLYYISLWLGKLFGPIRKKFLRKIPNVSMNDPNKIDDQYIEDKQNADPAVMVSAVIDLATDKWRLKRGTWRSGKVNLIIGEDDQLIERRKMDLLKDDLVNCEMHIIKGIGHTAVLEAYDELLKLVLDIVR